MISTVVKEWWDTYLSELDVQSFSLMMTPKIDYLYHKLFEILEKQAHIKYWETNSKCSTVN